MPFSRSSASYRFSRSSTNLSTGFLFLRGGFGGRKMHCTLCLTHELHGVCLLHLTFRSKQRMQAKVGFDGDRLNEDADGIMATFIDRSKGHTRTINTIINDQILQCRRWRSVSSILQWRRGYGHIGRIPLVDFLSSGAESQNLRAFTPFSVLFYILRPKSNGVRPN
jgi:hypothetical protein